MANAWYIPDKGQTAAAICGGWRSWPVAASSRNDVGSRDALRIMRMMACARWRASCAQAITLCSLSTDWRSPLPTCARATLGSREWALGVGTGRGHWARALGAGTDRVSEPGLERGHLVGVLLEAGLQLAHHRLLLRVCDGG